MKIKILRSTVCCGNVVEAGQVIDVNELDARLLIAIGKAVPVKDEGNKRTIEAPENTELPRGQKRSK
jgi:hypothetical protein